MSMGDDDDCCRAGDHDLDSFPNIIYSLPTVGHSSGIINRTPTAGFGQKSKYMPDYGGVLEIPGSSLKNNALSNQLPIDLNLTNFNELELIRNQQFLSSNQPSNDCLVVLKNDDKTSLAISAIGNYLYLDYVDRDKSDQSYSSEAVCRKKLDDLIDGLKISDDNLLVKLGKKIRVFKLKNLFEAINNEGPSSDSSNGTTSLDHRHYITASHSIIEQPNFTIRDCCLNKFNSSILAIASDQISSGQVKVYDVTESTREPFLTITMDHLVDNTYILKEDQANIVADKTLRRRSIRTFGPTKPATRGIQQLDNIPSHLVNMFISTDCKTSLIDPRLDQIAQVYIDRSKLNIFYPNEYLKTTRFSNINNHQFYSLSNVHLRVFDTRYLGLPMIQMNHMLDSDHYKQLHMDLIDYKYGNNNDKIEGICCSTGNRVAFLTFDQSCRSNLVNPKSLHPAYHDDVDDIVERLYSKLDPEKRMYDMHGLAIQTLNCDDNPFSILQLSRGGNIIIRDYYSPQKDAYMEDTNVTPQRADVIIDQIRNRFQNFQSGAKQNLDDNRPVQGDDFDSDDDGMMDIFEDFIDILDSSSLVAIPDSFVSQRACERFLKMKDSLARTGETTNR